MDGFSHGGGNNKQLNVLGNDLEPCKLSNDRSDITTGFYRDNCCNTGPDDLGPVSYTHLTLPTKA